MRNIIVASTFCYLLCIHHVFASEELRTHVIKPSERAKFEFQARLIEALPGDVIELRAGTYHFNRQIDIATDNITIRGAGSDKTVLSFKGQHSGGQGIESTGHNFVVADLCVQDTAGNAIKVLGARNVTFRDVKVEWTGGGKPTNGAYGLYPVQCQNVLIDNCTAIAASDAGIYVGQCRNVVVRNCHAMQNVAGIEIENTINADVYNNVATNNTGGILVFDLPGLQVKRGENVRVFKNKVFENNHPNFAAPGNAVASVPPGTGVMIMATDKVEVFDNDIARNQTGNVSLVSYHITGNKIKDKSYDAFSESVSIHDNRITEGGTNPGGAVGKMLAPVLGRRFPDILFDGMVDARKLIDGKLPSELQHSIVNNGKASFVDFNLSMLTPANVATGKYRITRDLAAFAKLHEPLAAVTLQPHDKPSSTSDYAVAAYLRAPKLLSEYQLFEGEPSLQRPAEDVIPYDLNTPLFSDYTSKFRFIRVPEGTTIVYRDEGVMEFPTGTLIAKTFAYPVDMREPDGPRRLLETRLEIKEDAGWYGYSYVWNNEQTDATLVLGGDEIDATWTHSDGSTRRNKYEIPNANQCLNCHSQGGEFVPIGPTAINMNRSFAFEHSSENQLAYMQKAKVLEGAPAVDEIAALPQFADPTDGSTPQRARAWLHVNCAHCHSPAGSARTSGLDLRLAQTDPAKFGVFKPPVAAGHGSGGRKYDIVPGKPDASILLFRIESEDPSIRMPNVARKLVPVEGVELVREWIAELEEEEDFNGEEAGG